MPQYREVILTIFGSYFGRNDDFINSFGNLLTFNMLAPVASIVSWFFATKIRRGD